LNQIPYKLANFFFYSRFDYGQNKVIDREALRNKGVRVMDKKDVTLDSEYNKIEKVLFTN